MTALTEIPVSDIEQVFSAVSILNKATEVKEEISEEAQVTNLTFMSRLTTKPTK